MKSLTMMNKLVKSFISTQARVAELVDATDSKSVSRMGVPVRSRPLVFMAYCYQKDQSLLTHLAPKASCAVLFDFWVSELKISAVRHKHVEKIV